MTELVYVTTCKECKWRVPIPVEDRSAHHPDLTLACFLHSEMDFDYDCMNWQEHQEWYYCADGDPSAEPYGDFEELSYAMWEPPYYCPEDEELEEWGDYISQFDGSGDNEVYNFDEIFRRAMERKENFNTNRVG